MSCFFFFNDTATTEIYTLSLHDALPIFRRGVAARAEPGRAPVEVLLRPPVLVVAPLDPHPVLAELLDQPHRQADAGRSEEHTSELQSRQYLVCRLLLEKKKYYHITTPIT